MRFIGTILGVVLVLAAATAAVAQSGGLRVVVLDAEDRSPLPGATVTLSNAVQLVAETTIRSDADGIAEFPVLRPGGGYIVQVTLSGYAGIRKDGIRIKFSETQIATVVLGAEITEIEEVVVKRDVVDLEKTSTSTSFGDEFIQDLPVRGRFYTNILTLAPGVQDEDEDGNPNVHGARERDFQTIVGGISNVDPLTGLRLSHINIDSIEEIEVITAGAGVEYGRAQGGFANVIEKQGSNEFGGLFNFVYRTSDLDGNGATNVQGSRIPDFQWVQPAVQVSGPILKDRLWYRLSHEYLKREDPINTGSAIAISTTERTTNSDMLTWQVSRRNKLAFSFLSDPQTVDNVGVSSTRPTEATWEIELGGPTYRMTWTAPYSPKVLVDTIVAYQDAENNIRPSTAGIRNNCLGGATLPALLDALCFNETSGLWSGSYNSTWEDQRQRFSVKTQANIFGGRFWGMNHQFKLGFNVENERYFRSLERKPDITFSVIPTASLEPLALVSARIAVPDFSTARATGTTWALYGEDQIKPLPHLTVTAGARVDREVINANGFAPFDPEAESRYFIEQTAAQQGDPFFNPNALLQSSFTAYESLLDFLVQLGRQLGLTPPGSTIVPVNILSPNAAASARWDTARRFGNIDITSTNVSPFLSVSWDPFRTGQTKIAATVGRHYDKIFLAVPLLELEPVTTDINFRAARKLRTWQVAEICPDGACLNPAANVSVVDRNLSTPYQDELTFTFERELAAETAVRLTYIRRRFRDQLQDIELNHAPGDFGRCMFQTSIFVEPLVDSPGEGQTLIDYFTGESYVDTDPGIGDGRLDDCIGAVVPNPNPSQGTVPGPGVPRSFGGLLVRPDGIVDSYVQNPAWGEIFLVGNFNTTDYEGVVVELTRRQYRNWQMNASYTWSEAVGNAEDFNQLLGNDRSLLEDEYGFLDYDQTHVFKFNATTIVPWAGGFRFGAAVQWQSGYPFSLFRRDLSFDAVPSVYASLGTPEPRSRLRYTTGRRNDQRNESWWNFDVHLAKEFNIRDVDLQVTADVFNLLNDDALRILEQVGGVNSSVERFGRRFQLGVRLAF